LIIQFVNITIHTVKLKYLEILLTLEISLLLNNEIALNGIWMTKKEATKKLDKFNLYACFKFPVAISQNALVVPQTGHSIPITLSNRQKCGKEFIIIIRE